MARSAVDRTAAIAVTQPGVTSSSASAKRIRSARAWPTAVLRAKFTPIWADESTMVSAGSRSRHASTTARVPSVDPLSLTTSSHGPAKSWRARAASWPAMTASPLRTGITTDTSGGAALSGSSLTAR